MQNPDDFDRLGRANTERQNMTAFVSGAPDMKNPYPRAEIVSKFSTKNIGAIS
ncbi:hypothetical protein MCP1_230079 [Candidatus Terasakiella magnetica]|nr:hypothetical protein MCP1_230079 [Candidatus Terasakiella magnetica]